MDTVYISGFAHGVFAGVIICYILGRMNKASATVKQRNKPLDTFPASAQPNLTPGSIVWKCTIARIKLVFWFIVLLAFIVFNAWLMEGVLAVW